MDALKRLSELRNARDIINIQFDDMRQQVLTPEIARALMDIEAERTTAMEAVNAGIEQAESQVKQEVAALGATVKAYGLQAVYSAGRVSWDTKALDGYAAAHPEIQPFRKVGAPSVSIREAK